MNREAALAVAALAGLVGLSGCGGAGPVIYRGESHGVRMMLKVSKVDTFAPLTLQFGRGSQAVRQRALRAKHLRFVCLWPMGSQGDGMTSMDLKLNPLGHTQVVDASVDRSSDGYACALTAPHGPPHSSPEWPAKKWLQGTIVAVRLVRSKR